MAYSEMAWSVNPGVHPQQESAAVHQEKRSPPANSQVSPRRRVAKRILWWIDQKEEHEQGLRACLQGRRLEAGMPDILSIGGTSLLAFWIEHGRFRRKQIPERPYGPFFP